MDYCTYEDVILWSGYHPSDMDQAGQEMDATQYQALVEMMITAATDYVNRYCNVTTFFTHEEIAEYHTVSYGETQSEYLRTFIPYGYYGYPITGPMYNEWIRIIYPRSQPVQTITEVQINTATASAIPNWITLVPRSETVAGDYEIVSRFETTYIYLMKNLPGIGKNNLRITYTAGYVADSPQLNSLKVATIAVVNNMLAYKKLIQEKATIRGAAIADYSPMFQNGELFVDENVRLILDKFRIPPLDMCLYE